METLHLKRNVVNPCLDRAINLLGGGETGRRWLVNITNLVAQALLVSFLPLSLLKLSEANQNDDTLQFFYYISLYSIIFFFLLIVIQVLVVPLAWLVHRILCLGGDTYNQRTVYLWTSWVGAVFLQFSLFLLLLLLILPVIID